MAKIIKISVYVAACFTLGILVFIIGYILIRGLPHLSFKLFEPVYTTENVSMLPAIVNTVLIMLCSLGISVPLGVCAAVYLSEYAPGNSKTVRIISYAAETLAGIPSIVYGLFGLLFFVDRLRFGYSILSGAATLAIMVLPLIMRTTEEALRSVPKILREGAFGLGAGKLKVIMRIVLPSAFPGILAGIILSTGRITGETAALIYTAGTVAQMPESLMSSGRTLSVHMYALSGEGLHMNEAFATAVILIILVLIINSVSSAAAERMRK